MSMSIFEKQTEERLRYRQTEGAEAGWEERESKEQQEDKEMGAKERMEQTAVEVKNTKRRMRNIMVNMQQVMSAVRAIRQQLGLIDSGEVPAVKRDQRLLDELKKKLAGLLGRMADLKLALKQEETAKLRQMNPNLSQEQLEAEVRKRVRTILIEMGVEE